MIRAIQFTPFDFPVETLLPRSATINNEFRDWEFSKTASKSEDRQTRHSLLVFKSIRANFLVYKPKYWGFS